MLDLLVHSFFEKDMNHMFWEISQQEAVDAVDWAIKWCKICNKHLWSSTAKVGEEILDRFGRSSASHFLVVGEDRITRFVNFDTNFLFTLGSIILSQGKKGVPIGGFSLAQIDEIWAIWKEHTRLFGDKEIS